jgi:uncharacterized membrane protein
MDELGQRVGVLYPNQYVWYVFASALDIMLTVTVLVHLGMREANTFAQWSIDRFGTWGLIGLKFLSVIVVVMICEYIGRADERRGRRLSTIAIGLSLIPIAAALAQTAYLALWGEVYWETWPPPPPPAS